MTELGMTYDDVAKAARMKPSDVKRIIHSFDPADHHEAGALADALDCDPVDIFVSGGDGLFFVRERGGPF